MSEILFNKVFFSIRVAFRFRNKFGVSLMIKGNSKSGQTPNRTLI